MKRWVLAAVVAVGLVPRLSIAATASRPSADAPVQHRVGAPPPDAYTLLLRRYVKTVGGLPGQNSHETSFDYLSLHAAADRDSLLAAARAYLLDGATPSKWDHDRRVAWAINAYNFLVIETVTKHLFMTGADAAAGTLIGSILDIRIDGKDAFKTPIVQVEGRTYTLDAFERRFVFDSFDPRKGGKPPKTLDPRAHFALVCAARGCPPLKPHPYTADRLTRDLDEATSQALMSPHHLKWDYETGRLQASSIFDWYAADFGGTQGALAFIMAHVRGPVLDDMKRSGVNAISAFISWDWRLNQTPERDRKH